jgi:hypothetical protein
MQGAEVAQQRYVVRACGSASLTFAVPDVRRLGARREGNECRRGEYERKVCEEWPTPTRQRPSGDEGPDFSRHGLSVLWDQRLEPSGSARVVPVHSSLRTTSTNPDILPFAGRHL